VEEGSYATVHVAADVPDGNSEVVTNAVVTGASVTVAADPLSSKGNALSV